MEKLSLLRHRHVMEVIKWSTDLRDPKFDPNKRDQWVQGIKNNLETISLLNEEMRKQFSHVMYEAQWLEPRARENLAPWGMLR